MGWIQHNLYTTCVSWATLAGIIQTNVAPLGMIENIQMKYTITCERDWGAGGEGIKVNQQFGLKERASSSNT